MKAQQKGKKKDPVLQPAALSESKEGLSSVQDNRSEAIAQRRLQGLADSNGSEVVQKKANDTGLPDNLKTGIENLSGHSMDQVKVHYNSYKPATMQAHAYAQGNQIHLGPGQEKHLPHEAWHVVQQKEGRVKPTLQVNQTPVNDDKKLEREADVMGSKSLEVAQKVTQRKSLQSSSGDSTVIQKEGKANTGSGERKEALDLANELKQHKSAIKTVPASHVDKVIETLENAAIHSDESHLKKGLTVIKGKAEKATHAPQKSETTQKVAQFSGWRFLGLLGGLIGGAAVGAGVGAGLGAIVGSIFPVVGTAFGATVGAIGGAVLGGLVGAVKGYQKGQIPDWRNRAIPAAFTPGNIQFATLAGANYGSIYFAVGRIRLVHGGGPAVEQHAGITRFTISNADYALYRAWRAAAPRTLVQMHAYVMALGSCVPAVVGAGQRLFEFFGVNGANGNHPSRGGPRAFPFAINQAQLNLIYNASRTGSNSALRRAMASDPLLRTIPMN